MQTTDLTTGSIRRNLMAFALPYMLAYFLQILYGLADLFVIGQYCGVDSTTAVSNGAQVMHFVTVVIIALAMGSTVTIARCVGAGDRARISRAVGNTLSFFLIVSVVAVAVLLLLCPSIIGWIETPAEAVAGTSDYLLVCFAGVPFIMLYNVIAAVFRGMGDSRTPMYLVAVACVVNIVLDYVFIGGCGLGPLGAALGTTLSQVVSVIVGAWAIRRYRSAMGLTRGDFRPHRRTLSEILKIGIPVAFQDGFIQVSFVIIMIIANSRGLNDAAAVGIVEKIIGLLFIIPSSMLSSVSAIAAQNFGAGKSERARTTLHYAIAAASAFGLMASIVLQFVPDAAVSIFTGDATVIASGADYLRSYTWDCFFAGIHFCYSGYFTAAGYAIVSFAHNVASIVLARVPLTYLFSTLYPSTLFPMGWASPVGSMLSVLICLVAYRWLARRGCFEAVG